MGKLNNFLFFYIFLFFTSSIEQIIIPLNPINDQEEPTVMTRESFTIQSNDGTPIRVTRIGIRRNNKNLNAGGDMRTPLELMRLMDDRINSIFEEIISQTMGLRIIFNDMKNINNEIEENKEEKKEENKEEYNENKTKEEEKNKNEEIIDDKEFELDENIKDEKIEENINNDTKYKENNNNEKNKDKNVKNNILDKNNKKEKKIVNKKSIGKLKVNPDVLKLKKKKKKLSYKEIIFSRVCKYIFYSIILFTIYILVRKLLELLEIIDPENITRLKDVKIDNNKEKNNEDKIKKQETDNDVIINKKKENKLN